MTDMLKQTIVWTALPHGSSGPLAAGTTLRLSAVASPRLFSIDAGAGTLMLSDFPDFLDWPAVVGKLAFQVAFDGQPPLTATVKTKQPLRSDLWKALFKPQTQVVPFAFNNMTGVEFISYPAVEIHDAIRGIYQRAATDPAYGGGVALPNLDVLGSDPDLTGIARPVDPPKRYEPVFVDTPPVFVGTHGPEPTGIVPQPAGGTTKPKPDGCLTGCAGCLAAPLALLRRLLKWIGLLATLPVTMGGMSGGSFGSRTRVVSAPESSTGGAGGGPSGPPADPPPPMSSKRSAFEQLQIFVQPTSTDPQPMPQNLDQKYDFHQMVSTLGDYPNLMRYLGLAIDLEVTLSSPLPSTPGMVKVTLLPEPVLAMKTTHYTPRTHYELSDSRFVAQSGPAGELHDGLLRVDDTSRFQLLQLDVAGSGIKVQGTATTVVDLKTNGSPGTEPEEQGLPALRTAGLSIVRAGLAAELKSSFVTSWVLNAALAAVDNSVVSPAEGDELPPEPSDELWAEDVVRGYRIDVLDDKSNRWHSLCRRVGTYRFDEVAGGAVTLTGEEDESFVQTAVTEPVNAEGPRVLRAHESLFTWSGWSLGAPRFGNTILPDFDMVPAAEPRQPPLEVAKIGAPLNDTETQFKLRADFRPPEKSLPRLRFGYKYRLRVRAADLAGNSVFTPDDAAFQTTQATVTPEVTSLRFEPVSPPIVMLQTIPAAGESLERLVVRSQFDKLPPPGEATVRHLVPPKTSQLMAEQHRKFDGDTAMNGDSANYILACREAGSLMKQINPNTFQPETIPGASAKTLDGHPYAVQVNDTFELAYLPDPFARGVLLMGLPGMNKDEVVEPGQETIAPGVDVANRIPFVEDWLNLKPIRLRVTGIAAGATPARPQWQQADHLLSVQVPQGETYEVLISSWLNDSDLDRMAIWDWMAQTGVSNLNQLRGQAAAGRNWLTLPFRKLVLVHAVMQPLVIPKLDGLSADDRPLGETVATLHGQVLIDAKSTQKVDLEAAWSDPIDDLAQPAFTIVNHQMHVTEVQALDTKSDSVSIEGAVHALGDTKFHLVTYSTTATSRFREYFDPKTATTALIRPTPTENVTVLPGDKIKILNTLRPDSPKLLYALPTFAWERDALGLHAFRRSGGIRVYMDRPWYSSGDGELLGVTLLPSGGDDDAGLLKKYTSEWGMDPLWPAASTAPLAMSDFAGPVSTMLGVPLEEVSATVDVVGYRPRFDPDRGLWYCDITLRPGNGYFPMVRLALVRFQPDSVDGAHISRVVLADFLQLVPDREVTYDAATLHKDGRIGIEVSGPAYVFPPMGSSQFVARLEHPSGTGTGDELSWEPLAMDQPAKLLEPVMPMDTTSSVWQTVVTTPIPRIEPLRLVILELERYTVDGRGSDPLGLFGAGAPGIDHVDSRTSAFAPPGFRVTFADALELP